MARRPFPDEDPTSEEQVPAFDGTQTDQVDNTHRLRIVTATESANGTVSFDDRGQPQWKWITETHPFATDSSGTFDQLKALDNPALSLEREPAAEPKPGPVKGSGYDPYATAAPKRPKSTR